MRISVYVVLCALIFGFISCYTESGGKTDPESGALDMRALTLYAGDSARLNYSGGRCVWKSDNELIATVSDGNVRALHVGQTQITANKAVCKVDVKANYNTFVEPFVGWGAGLDSVKTLMRRYTLDEESSALLRYKGDYNVAEYEYNFREGKLYHSMMTVEEKYGLELKLYLCERYVVMTADTTRGTFLMKTPSGDLTVRLSSNDEYVEVEYF